jgi:predicted Zn-dependent peptidase
MINRTIAPEIKTISHLNTGYPKSDSNIFRVESEEEVFKLEIVFPNAGYSLLENKYCGIYAMDLLFSGTHDKNAETIADEIDVLGGYIFKVCDYYTSSITIFGISENIKKLIEIAKYCIENCNYSLDEVNILKNKRKSELKINLNKTNYLANRQINQLIFGQNHPYSEPITEQIINKINTSDLLNYIKIKLVNPYFIFTGSKSTGIEEILEEYGFNKGSFKIENTNEVQAIETEGEELIIKEGSTQNSIRMGKKLPSKKNPDFFKISLVNLILGGYFGSRLMKNIREEKGLTYGIHSSITPFKTYSIFKISSECNNKLTETVKSEIISELTKLREELVDIEELTVAKNYLLGAISRNFDGAFNISDRFKTFLEIDNDYSYYISYFKAIHDINAQDIRECANNYFDPNSFKYCVAGEM